MILFRNLYYHLHFLELAGVLVLIVWVEVPCWSFDHRQNQIHVWYKVHFDHSQHWLHSGSDFWNHPFFVVLNCFDLNFLMHFSFFLKTQLPFPAVHRVFQWKVSSNSWTRFPSINFLFLCHFQFWMLVGTGFQTFQYTMNCRQFPQDLNSPNISRLCYFYKLEQVRLSWVPKPDSSLRGGAIEYFVERLYMGFNLISTVYLGPWKLLLFFSWLHRKIKKKHKILANQSLGPVLQ